MRNSTVEVWLEHFIEIHDVIVTGLHLFFDQWRHKYKHEKEIQSLTRTKTPLFH